MSTTTTTSSICKDAPQQTRRRQKTKAAIELDSWEHKRHFELIWSESKNTEVGFGYLQCTRTGPMSAVRAADERLMKVRTGRVYSGTPMSGHWV